LATFEEFQTILLGAELHDVHTDHRNLTFNNLNTARVLRWRIYLEEYGPTFHYIPGKENVLGDAFLCLPQFDPEPNAVGKEQLNDTTITVAFLENIVNDDQLLDCYLNHPPLEVMQYPLHYDWIQQHQQADLELQQIHQRRPQEYPIKTMRPGLDLICHRRVNALENKWKICVPTNLLNALIHWYHWILGHGGINRMYNSISNHFYHPKQPEAQCRTISLLYVPAKQDVGSRLWRITTKKSNFDALGGIGCRSHWTLDY
jgi:hypothetical protein